MALGFFAMFMLAAASFGSTVPWWSQVWMGALPLAVLAAVSMLLGFTQGHGEVHVDETGLRWNGRLLLDQVREGERVLRAGSTSVRLRGRQGEALLGVASEQDADDLLAAAGVSGHPSRRTYHVAKADSNQAILAGVIALAFFVAWPLVILLHGVGIILASALIVAILVVARRFVNVGFVTLTVGEDGVSVQEDRKKPRFIPYANLSNVVLTYDSGRADGLVLRLADGGALALAVPPTGTKLDVEEPAREIADRIQRARKGSLGEIRPRGAITAALAQGGRSTAEWVVNLRNVLAEATSYRAMPVSREELEAVLHDGTAGKQTRLAAAIALSATDREKGTKSVRIAADACAAEDLATKFRIAAEDDVDPARLGDALDELDAEDDPANATEASRSGSSSA